MRVEHEYERRGAWAYLAALDVHRAKVFGRCEAKTGIAPFERLVEQVMSQSPYNNARRVFWIMDNGSSHRGDASVRRLTQAHPDIGSGPWSRACQLAQPDRDLLLHRPAQGAHPQRLPLLGGGRRAAGEFERYFESIARPFEWKFTRADLNALIARMRDRWARSQPFKLAA